MSLVKLKGVVPVAVALVVAVLAGAIFGRIHIPGLGILRLFPRAHAFDYSASPFNGFAPLNDDYIQRVLGRTIPVGALRDIESPAHAQGLAYDSGDSHRVTDVHPLTNDRASDARRIPSVPFQAVTDTRGSTRGADDPDDCGSVGNTVWYRYQAVATGSLAADTVGSDHATTLSVFTGRVGALELVACDTDPYGNASAAFSAARGTTYYFQIAAPAGDGRLVFNLDPPGQFALTSKGRSAEPGSDSSTAPAVSADGRLIAFASFASNLDPTYSDASACLARDPSADPSREQMDAAFPSRPCMQVYLADRATRHIRMISRSSGGSPGNGWSDPPDISANGRFVAFGSTANNLVTGDDNGISDVFVRDTSTGKTERVSIGSHDEQATLVVPSDLVPATRGNNRPSEASYLLGEPRDPSISDDGRFVAFSTSARLVSSDTDNVVDIYVRDLVRGTTQRVSVRPDGGNADGSSGGACMSPDGTLVAFHSNARNLVPGDTNANPDVFVRDRVRGRTTRVSVSGSGRQGSDGSWTGIRCFSADDRKIVFDSRANELVDGDTNNDPSNDVFVHDLVTRATTRASLMPDGSQAWGWNGHISRDGRYVVFQSDQYESDVNADVANIRPDIFMRDLVAGVTLDVTLPHTRTASCHDGYPDVPGFIGCEADDADLSADGSVIVFESRVWIAAGVGALPARPPSMYWQIYSYERAHTRRDGRS